MSRMNLGTGILLLATAALFTGCNDATAPGPKETAPHPGTVTLGLVSPATDDGAVLFRLDRGRLSADDIQALRPARDDLQVFTSTTDDGWMVAVVGDGLAGALVLVDVADVSRAVALRTTLLEVADEANQLRRDLSGYRVALMADGSPAGSNAPAWGGPPPGVATSGDSLRQ